MLKYVIRRVLYMIPTVLGVVLITFILFNIAGGSPATMKLGKQATPKTLEDYEVQRGYDKPLFLGVWGKTRAYSDMDLSVSASPWNGVKDVEHVKDGVPRLLFSEGRYAVPLSFALYDNTSYRWYLRYRMEKDVAAHLVVTEAGKEIERIPLRKSKKWCEQKIVFGLGANAADRKYEIVLEGGGAEFRNINLRKKARNAFDSQLVFYLGQIVRFDFGRSSETNQKISTMIKEGAGPSLALMIPMFIIGVILSVSISLICAFFRDSAVDKSFVILSVVLMSVNYLVWIIVGQHMLGYKLRAFPIWGFESWRYLVLPCFIGIISSLGASIRFYRTVMLEEVNKDYVRTAFAKGVSKKTVLFKHVLKNAMIPIITSVVMSLPFLVTGSLLLETFFGIPGLGSLAINAINSSDFDVIRAIVFIMAMMYVVANLMTDICYAAVDPRVKLK